MTNEIKEILEFKENADYKRLSVDEIVILEDYITNLQEENERLKTTQIFIDTQDPEERCGQALYEDMLKRDCEKLQQRIDKAVEYIDKWCLINENGKCLCYLPKDKCTKLLNILRGDE